jgi:RHS repeat-associated protein
VLCVAVVVGTQTIASAQPPAGAVRPQPAGAAAKGAWGPAGSSRDVAVAGYGDGAGYHVQVARESDNFAWRDVAVLRPAGLDESAWYGYQCLAGDGTHVAVTVLPGGLVNLQGARLRGAYGYSVDLTTGHVAALLSGVSFQYSSPGCGTGSLATFTSSLDDSESVTSLAVVDLATGTVGQQSVVAGQVTSAVPVGDSVVGAAGRELVAVGPGGTGAKPGAVRVLADAKGLAFDLHAAADGGVDFVATDGSDRAVVRHWDGAKVADWGSGPLGSVVLAAGRAGHNTVLGLKQSAIPGARLRAVSAGALAGSAGAVSVDGDAVFGSPADQPEAAGQPLSQVIGTQSQQVLEAGQLSTGPAVAVSTGTSEQALPGIELNESFAVQQQFVTTDLAQPAALKAPTLRPSPLAALTTGPATSKTAATAAVTTSTPKCAVPRLDPARQALQPSPAQVDWAAQMAEQGLLMGAAYTRPANFANMGLAAYAPSSDFARVSLHHPAGTTWDTVPRSVMEAVMAQESNLNQASWHALPGIAGAPLVGNYYGASGSIRTIDYSKSDCGYGIAQVTTGMAASDTSISTNGKAKVGVDYQENIAAGLRILQQAWNALYDAGITANGGDPKYLENWYLAIWAYNSGIQPTAAFGNTTNCTPSATCTGPDGTWGLGWSNNPANPSYPPSRTAYLRSTYADAAHPADWPYQERVLGWMASPIIRLSQTAYARPDYHGGQTWLQLPAPSTFCTSANLCDPAYVDPANAAHTVCTLADYECWWHSPVSWVASCATTCTTSAYAVTTGSSEPPYSSPHPPTCNVDASKLPTTSNGAPIVVDEIANPLLNRQGCTGLNWSNAGTFAMSYGTNAAGDLTGQIDTHQLGAGFGGHIFFTHTEAADDSAVINTGTWTPTLPSLHYYKVKIHIPATGAAATDVVYTINPGGGAAPWKIRVNQAWGSEQWVTIGTFAMQNGGTVQLSNASSMAAGIYDVAYDAIAFLPQGGTPGQPIGGPPTVQDAPKGSNPAWVNCGCVRRTAGDPVDTATGYFGESFTDLTTPGRGAALNISRTYNAALADPAGPNATLATDGAFGHGWSFGYALTATTNATSGAVVIGQEDGSQVTFTATGGTYAPSSPRFDATLTAAGGTYTFTRRGTDVFVFDAATGHLVSQTDLAGTQAVPTYATNFTYNPAGKLAAVTDPAGRAYTFTWTGSHITSVSDGGARQIDYAYSAAGDLTDVYGPNTVRTGSSLGDQDHTQFTYDSHHLMVSARTPANFGSTITPTPVTSMVYDTAQRVTSQTDPDGRTTTFTYGPASGLTAGQTRVVNPAGNATLYTYQNGLLVSETRGEGTTAAGTWSYTYDPLTLGLTTASDPNGHVTTATYDDHGNRTSTSDALGYSTSYLYDGHGHVVLTTDPSGTQTAATYNAAGMLTATSTGRPGQSAEVADGNPTDPTVRTTSRAYSDAAHPGDLTSSTDARGKTTTVAYDATGYPIKTTDPLNHATLARYDQRTGRLLATVTPLGAAAGTTATCTTPATGCTTYDYDTRGHVTSTHDPAEHTTTATYDRDGHQVTTTDANAHTTTVGYDPAGQVVSATRADGTVTTTSYTGDGRVAATVDANRATASYTYDAQGRNVTSTDPDQRTTTTGFDPAGNVITATTPDGAVTTYGHDAANRITAITYSDGKTPNVAYTYDVNGRRTGMTDGTGTTTTTYDTFGEVTKTTDGAGAGGGYAYDEAGHVTTLTYPGTGRSVTRTFDDAGNLTSVKDWNNKTTSFTYDANNALTTTVNANGTTATTTRDALGVPLSSTLTKANTTLASIAYTRDAISQIDTETTVNLGPARTYANDALGRLTKDTATSYAYDSAGNLTTNGSMTQAYDPAGQITSAASSATTTNYGFDTRGNRTTATSNAAVTTYVYDQASRLTGYTRDATIASYTYNGDGLRASKVLAGATSRFVYDTVAAVPLILSDGAGYYLYGPNGLPIEQITSAGVATYLHGDQLGSIRMLTNSTGESVGTASYTAYGTRTTTGTTSPFGFAGQYTDAETGLQWLRARYYDPATAQFLTVDPITAATGTRYTYADGNPVTGSDPTGLGRVDQEVLGSARRVLSGGASRGL